MSDLELAAMQARAHADNLRADIPNAMTRSEHIRLSRLAIEADGVASRIENLVAGVAVSAAIQ